MVAIWRRRGCRTTTIRGGFGGTCWVRCNYAQVRIRNKFIEANAPCPRTVVPEDVPADEEDEWRCAYRRHAAVGAQRRLNAWDPYRHAMQDVAADSLRLAEQCLEGTSILIKRNHRCGRLLSTLNVWSIR